MKVVYFKELGGHKTTAPCEKRLYLLFLFINEIQNIGKWQLVKPQIQTDQITREIGEAHGVLVLLAKGSMFFKENLCIKLIN